MTDLQIVLENLVREKDRLAAEVAHLRERSRWESPIVDCAISLAWWKGAQMDEAERAKGLAPRWSNLETALQAHSQHFQPKVTSGDGVR